MTTMSKSTRASIDRHLLNIEKRLSDLHEDTARASYEQLIKSKKIRIEVLNKVKASLQARLVNET